MREGYTASATGSVTAMPDGMPASSGSRTAMRRLALGATFAGIGVLVARAAAPKLHARLMAACERMFEEMPETFPPKRMLRGIEEISATSARTLELLERPEVLERASSKRGRSPHSVEASQR